MLASKGITIGLIIAGLGGALLAAEDQIPLEPAVTRPAAFVLLLLGAIAFFSGFAGLATLLQPPKGVHKDDTAAAAMALIRAMLAISVADGHLDDSEVSNIAKIYKQVTGSDIPEQTIRETASSMLEEGADISSEMNTLRGTLDENMKLKIIKASLFILAADGKVEADEEAMLEEIRQGLKVSSGKVKQIKENFLRSKGLAT